MARVYPRPKKEDPRATPVRQIVRFPGIKAGNRDSDEDILNELGKEEP